MLLDQYSIHSWIQTNQIKTESGQTLDFHTHRYLFDIYRDESKYLCCIKAGQIGFSTMAILKTIWMAKNRNINIGYILPTSEMVEKFVGSKVNRMAQQNPIISSWMKDKDKISEKQIGDAYIFYLGSQTDRSAIMLSLDMLVGDEFDKSPQSVMETYDSRLQHSKHGYKWVFSNPTIPNFGVDRFWEMSDKKKMYIKHSCKEIYILDESCIDYKAEIYRCPKCKGEISNECRRMGEWVNHDGIPWKGTLEPNYKWSGWWIPLWINPLIPASTIADHKRTKTAEYFANFVAGLPYINTTNMLSQQILESNLTNKVNSQEGRVIIGIDTGHNIHYVLSNKDGIFNYGYCPSVEENSKGDRIPNYNPWDKIEVLLRQFPRSIAIIDQGGDLIGPRILQEKYRGRVYLIWTNKESKNLQLIKWSDNDEEGKVSADRNRMIQLVVDEIKDQRLPFWGNVQDSQPYFDHWLNIYRVREDKGEEGDPQYNWRWVWKRKGPDHWALATVYARVGLDRFGQDLAQIVHKGSVLGNVPIAFKGSITEEPNNPMGIYQPIDM